MSPLAWSNSWVRDPVGVGVLNGHDDPRVVPTLG